MTLGTGTHQDASLTRTGISSGSSVPAPHFARAPRLTLEICRGRTRFPQRPVSGPRFFIGSGEGCDLRLGGDVLPSIHSLIQNRGDGIWLEAIAENPPLLLNGHVTKGEWLRDGDLLDIGPFQLVAHLIPVQTQFKQAVTVTPPSAQTDFVQVPVETEPDLAELSASELVDLIEQEQARVDEFEQNQRAGAEALLQAIRKRQRTLATVPRVAAPIREALPAKAAPGREPTTLRPQTSQRELRIDASVKNDLPAAPKAAASDDGLLHDLEHLCKELNQLSHELERRSAQADQREATFATAALSLLNAQRHLKAQIDVVAEQVAALHGRSKEPGQSRAIA